ncbi:MAG: prepilin-type N-terminal cleavage/methylation domain-containing protein [Planctomycetaceae bacterium]|nr:prepilin-type N-terminal cleavage/methylation domain-containing protein [Planctomycetaceae bacterium]
MTRTTRRRGRGGFTLIEAAIATALLGTGVTALMLAVQSGTSVNGAGRKMTQAVFLAQEIREWTLRLPFVDPQTPNNPPGPDGTSPQTFVDDLNDLMNVTYSPPRDAYGSAITDMSGWSQTITMTWRDPDNLSAAVANGASDIVRVEVSVSFKGQPVHTSAFLAVRRSTE